MELIGTLLVFVVLIPLLLWLLRLSRRGLRKFLWGFVAGRDGLNVFDLIGILFLATAGWLVYITVLQLVARSS